MLMRPEEFDAYIRNENHHQRHGGEGGGDSITGQ